MKRKFAFTLLMGLIVGAAALSSCSKENEQPKPKPTPTPNPKEEPKPANGLPEITKVTFRIGESHLHSKKGIHFLGNNAVLNHSYSSRSNCSPSSRRAMIGRSKLVHLTASLLSR